MHITYKHTHTESVLQTVFLHTSKDNLNIFPIYETKKRHNFELLKDNRNKNRISLCLSFSLAKLFGCAIFFFMFLLVSSFIPYHSCVHAQSTKFLFFILVFSFYLLLCCALVGESIATVPVSGLLFFFSNKLLVCSSQTHGHKKSESFVVFG